MADARRARPIKSCSAGIRRRRMRRNRENGCDGIGKGVPEKLEALKRLVQSTSGEVAVEELFRETADYILRLKAQVLLLQGLICIYGCSGDQVGHIPNAG